MAFTPPLSQLEAPAGFARPGALKRYAETCRSELLVMLETPGQGGVALARRHADMGDAMLRRLFDAVACNRHEAPSSRQPLLLGAVGGYGRRLLGLESDLDVCFVAAGNPERVTDAVEAIMYPLWDAGISVGHQIIQAEHVAADVERELAMATELLDFRPLCGDAELFAPVRQQLYAQAFAPHNAPALIARLEEQAISRHEQFGDSVYLLEPDVKLGTGGLRDLDYALWASRVRFSSGDLAVLAKRGVLRPEQLVRTERAVDFLWTVRNHLHHISGRKYDRLTFGEQETVAEAMGFARHANSQASPLERTGQMVEAFMSEYYRHARVIAQARDRLLGRAKRRRSGGQPGSLRSEGDLVFCDGRLGLSDPTALVESPVLALRVYMEAVTRELGVLSRTRDAIATAAADSAFCDELRGSEEAAQLFVRLVCSSRQALFGEGSILGELHDVGLLLAMVPEFAPVVGRVHHDLYHVYTVDVHSIAAVDRLRALKRGDLSSTFPLASRLSAEATRPRVLFLATLLHDVGKAIGGKDHAQRGAEMARHILSRLRLPADEIADACHHIQHHLTMYMLAVRRDLGDPITVQEFAQVVHGREQLRELYLLTVADLSTTSTTSMTKWKRSMLDGLFRATDAYLAGERTGACVRAEAIQASVRELWNDPERQSALDEYMESMPARYFLTNSPAEIAAHAKLALAPRESAFGLSMVPSSAHAGVTELCVVSEERAGTGVYVVAGDRPGLLAAISAAISANRLEIQAAQINSRTLKSGDRQAVDLFWVRGIGPDEALEERLAKLEVDLKAVLAGEVAPEALVRPRSRPSWSSRPMPAVHSEVLFDHHGSSHHTIIEVLCEDRRALLYTLTTALYRMGLTITVAKISTEGSRAVDVFYANEADGSKIDPGPRTVAIREAILTALTKEN